MSNRLGGRQGTAYLGTNAIQPPDYTFSDRDPNQYDVNNVSLGDLWLNQSDEGLWVLVSLKGIPASKGSLATWVKLESGGIGGLNALTGNTGGMVSADANSNINIIGDGIGITITGNPVTNTLTASLIGGGEAAESFPTDAGTATPVNGVLNVTANTEDVNAGSSVSFSGTGDTVTLNVTDSNDNTIIGRNSGSALITGGDNTILGEESGFALTSGSDNTIIGGTAGGSLTSGSNNIIFGSGAGSTLSPSSSSNTLIGGAGFSGASEFLAIMAGAGGNPVVHNYPGSNSTTTNGGNTFVGMNAGNFTLTGSAGNASNNGFGDGALGGLTTAANNNAMGAFTLSRVTTGGNNTAIGHGAGFNSGANTGLITGANNVLLGYNAGSNYAAAESNNIIIGTVVGTAAESNTLRLGAGTGTGTGQINKSFISGIRGITPTTNDGIPVFINSLGQLGTVGTFGSTIIQTVTGNSGGAVSPAAGNLNIVGDGTTIQITGNPGTNTLTVVGLGGGGGDLSILTGDSGSATASGGTINVITGNSSQDAGSSVLFDGSGNTIQLEVTDAGHNTLIGFQSGNATLTGTNNTGLGSGALTDLTTGSANTCLGTSSGNLLTTGSSNVIIGASAGDGITTGTNNIIFGISAGSNYASSESNNISIGSSGIAAESNVLRIGQATGTGSGQINQVFIAGIRGTTPATNNGIPVFINSLGQFGTVGSGGTSLISTVTGNTGGAVSPAAGNINIVGDGTTIQITGNPGTNTLTVVGLGGGGGDLSILTGDFGSATASGGTINVKAGTSTLNAGSSVSFAGASNNLTFDVTDNNNNTIIGFNSGKASITGSNNTALGVQCGAALTSGGGNIFLGNQAGSLVTTGNGNFLCGDASLNTVLKGTTTSTGFYALAAGFANVFLHNWGGTASGNTFVGSGSAGDFNAGQQVANKNNTSCGTGTLSSLTTAINNTVLGYSAGANITSGGNNTFVGLAAGLNYMSSESSNICIGAGVGGTVSTSNTLTIGNGTGTGSGQINVTRIAGIRGITTAISNALPVVIDSSGQLGTGGGASVITSLTANSGGTVSATGGNVNVRGDGTTITIVGNPGTSTLTASLVGTVPTKITGNSGGAVSATSGNINIRGDGTSVNVVGTPGSSLLTISAVGGAAGPSFMAYVTTTLTNATTPGVSYQFQYDTIGYNLGSAFNLGTSTFTAPVTGLYNFSSNIGMQFNSSTTKRIQVYLTTTGSNYCLTQHNISNTNYSLEYSVTGTLNVFTIPGGNVYAPMTAGDTAILTTIITAGSATASILGTSLGGAPVAIRNFFSGELA
jgi:hypothetical protein